MTDVSVSTLLKNPRALLFGGVFLTLVVVLIAAYLLVLRQTYAVLVADARPMEAAAIVAELEEQGIPYRLRDRGQTILVPTARSAGAHLMIAGADTLSAGAPGLEIFEESNMGLTEFAQRVRYQRAITGEMVRTILLMDNISDVRVHVAMPENGLFRADDKAANAAIWVATRDGVPLDATSVEGVRRLAVAAVPDLRIENVAVLDSGGAILTALPMTSSGSVDASSTESRSTSDSVDVATSPEQPASDDEEPVSGDDESTNLVPELATPSSRATHNEEGLFDPGAPSSVNQVTRLPSAQDEPNPRVNLVPTTPNAGGKSSSVQLPGGLMSWLAGGITIFGLIYYGVTRHLIPRPSGLDQKAGAESFATHLDRASDKDDQAAVLTQPVSAFSPALQARLHVLESSDYSAAESGLGPRAAEAIAGIMKQQIQPANPVSGDPTP